jgi:hypothetical protein
MHRIAARFRQSLGRRTRGGASTADRDVQDACSWETMREVYRQQAERGVPEAIEGLARIEQGRWPGSGRPRDRAPGG